MLGDDTYTVCKRHWEALVSDFDAFEHRSLRRLNRHLSSALAALESCVRGATQLIDW
jgi:hypothetical protein